MKDSSFKKIVYIINGFLAWLLYKVYFQKKYKNNIWLIGGHLGQIYDDNSKVFFEYILNEYPQIDIYWVLNKNSLAETQINSKEKVLYRGSLKAYLYCYLCDCIIISHSFADVMPIFYKNKEKYKMKVVHLEHGVYGLKKVVYKNSNYCSYFDLICTVGEIEQGFKLESLNVEREKLKITGLSRYDRLNRDNKGNGNIIVMFTWREYEDKSNYISKVISFLKNEKLARILKENNIYMNVVLHSFMHNYHNEIDKISEENIKILSKDTNIQEQLNENSLLITDYSSVSWDFAYMGKPVIFYQFDLDEYLEVRESYIDLRRDLFGLTASNEDEVVNLIEKYANNRLDFSKIKKVDYYFKFIDNDNCRRIYNEIIKLIKESN